MSLLKEGSYLFDSPYSQVGVVHVFIQSEVIGVTLVISGCTVCTCIDIYLAHV